MINVKMRTFISSVFLCAVILCVFPVRNVQAAPTAAEAFVTRLYQVCLSREPDAEGMNTWTTLLTTGKITGALLALNFLNSSEFVSLNVSNEEYVKVVYQVMLNRLPDPTGQSSWTGMLNDGVTRYYMLSHFVKSEEYIKFYTSYGIKPGDIYLTENVDKRTDLAMFVTRFYKTVLGRFPEHAGLKYYVDLLATKQISGAQLSESFLFSNEFLQKTITDSEYLNILYRVFLNRDIDPVGAETWTNTLKDGYTRRFIVANLVGSSEYASLCGKFGISIGGISLGVIDTRPDLVKFVTRFYEYTLSRKPDYQGLVNHITALANKTLSGSELAEGFILSDEFTKRDLNSNEFVSVLYRSFFDREPDEGGMTNWLTVLMNGYARRFPLAGFVNSSEFKVLSSKYNVNAGAIITGANDAPFNGTIRAYALDDVNFRLKPDFSVTPLMKLLKDTRMVVIGRVPDFYKVRYLTADNKLLEGFVFDNLVQPFTDDVTNSMLGSLSGKYESNGNPGTISTGVGDWGGKSYGAWQFASNPEVGSLQNFLNWLMNEKRDFYDLLNAAKVKDNGCFGENFDTAWKSLAQTSYDAFLQVQHKYIKLYYYDALIKRLVSAGAYDQMLGSFAVRNVLWSTAVQHGVGGAFNIITKYGHIKDKEQFITAVYEERSKVDIYFWRSPSLWTGLINRFKNEKSDALGIYKYETTYK